MKMKISGPREIVAGIARGEIVRYALVCGIVCIEWYAYLFLFVYFGEDLMDRLVEE